MADNTVNKIPARLKSAVVGGHVAGVEDIIDDNKGINQKQINEIHEQVLSNLGEEMSTLRQEMDDIEDGIQFDQDGDLVSEDGTDFSDPTKRGKIPTIGSIKDGADPIPTTESDNLVKSGGVQNELALGAVYDVTAKNPTAGPNNDGKWESLNALLSDAYLSTLIPTAVRKGGMSIKFVQSSDNNYVQYMYKGTSTSAADFTNADNWEKINLEEEVSQLGQKLIKLVGFGTISGGNSGVTKVGDIYYSTSIKKICECTSYTSSTNFEQVALPFFDGAIYTYNNNLYIWNGSDLVSKTLADEEPISESKNLVESGGVYNKIGLIAIVFPIKNYRISPLGVETSQTGWECSEFIRVVDIDVKYLRLRNTNNVTACIYFYSENKEPISGITTDGTITINMYNVPQNAYYVRFCRAFPTVYPGYDVFVNVDVTKELYKKGSNNIIQFIDNNDELNPKTITDAIIKESDYFTLTEDETTDVYLTDGTTHQYNKFAMTELFPVQSGMVLLGTLVASTVNICAIVFFDINRVFISGIYKQVSSAQYFNIDTTQPDMTIPTNAKYFAVQGPTMSTWFSGQSLKGKVVLTTILNDTELNLNKLNLAVFGSEPISLLWPRVIYNVGNNIDMEKNNFPRNYSTCLYIDNFLPNGLLSEPKVLFGDKKIIKAIPCYEPPMPNNQGLDGSYETPKMNNGQDIYTETVSIEINNNGTTQTRNITNRCVLNSAAKNKKIAILCIGDSITYGQNAYFTESPNKANYTMLLAEMFKKDNIQEGSGYDFDTIGTIKYNRIFSYDGIDYNIPCFNEGYSGRSMQDNGLFTNPKFLDENDNFSFNNWLNKYRTKDDDGIQLYFDENGATTGVGGNYGYYADGTQSSFKIGTEVTNVADYNVYKPTHIFLFHCTNQAITKAEYNTFISYVRDVFPDAIIGLGAPHMAGTYYPSFWPQYCKCERWNDMLNYSNADNRQYNTEKVLLEIADDSSYEQNNVFVLSTFFVNPSADALGGLAVSQPYNDFIAGGDIFMPKGQGPQAHVGGKAHAAYAYQLYGWTKWTLVNNE